jgi:hypothetical protein
MFGHRFFGGAYFGGRYYGDGGNTAPPGASAAQVWAYVLSNGKSAGQNLVEVNTMLATLTGAVEGSYTMFDILKILAAVAAGKTRITPQGGDRAHVEFDHIDESGVAVAAEMDGSERTDMTLTP